MIRLAAALAVFFLTLCHPYEALAMSMVWEKVLQQDEGSVGGIGDIFYYDGRYYAIASENTKRKWHVIVFDEHGTILETFPEKVVRSSYAQNNDRFVGGNLDGLRVYELPALSVKKSQIEVSLVAQGCFQNTSTSLEVPFFLVKEYGDGKSISIAAVNRDGTLLWRKQFSDGYPFSRGMMLTRDYAIVYMRPHGTGETTVTLLSLQGEVVKTIHLDKGAKEKVFDSLGKGLQLDDDHILIAGSRNRTELRLAKVNIRTNVTEVTTLPTGYSNHPDVSLLPDGTLVLTWFHTYLLDKNFKPFARFPAENFPGVWVAPFALAPNGDFIFGGVKGARQSWIGRFRFSDFVPCDNMEWSDEE